MLAPAAGAATNVTCGDTISTPGSYFLAADCGGAGITITSSNVTLKLNGHTMTGTGGPLAGEGVLVDDGAGPVSGVNVLGPGTITEYNEGVQLGNLGGGVSGSTVKRLTANDKADGILMVGATGDTISGNALNNNSNGVTADGSGNVIQGNTPDNNAFGINVAGTDNTVNGNTVDTNSADGIFVRSGATGNTINANTTDNNRNGIVLQAEFGRLTTGNTINANTADNNRNDGILLNTSATGNTINANTALGNPVDDLFDGNPGCDTNVWNGNRFQTANQTCIH